MHCYWYYRRVKSFIFFSANALAAAGAFVDRTRTQKVSLRFLKRSFSRRMHGPSLCVREIIAHTFREPTFESLRRRGAWRAYCKLGHFSLCCSPHLLGCGSLDAQGGTVR